MEARGLVSEALRKAEEELPADFDYTVSIGWTGQDFVIENMDGTHGRTFSADFFKVNFNTSGEKWRKAIKVTAVHEYAHSWYYAMRYDGEGRNDKVWQYVIDEALTQNFAEKIFPEYIPDHRLKHGKEKIAEYWPEIRDNELHRNTEDVSWPYILYINKTGEGYPNWLGYSMSYLIGQELLKNHSLEDFPELEKNHVVETGNKIFEA